METIDVVGAGPAGLAAAITFARAGRRVMVHEAQKAVGYRFHRDLQGVDDWTALDILKERYTKGEIVQDEFEQKNAIS